LGKNIFKNNYAYLFWFLLYILLFGIPTAFIIVPFYLIVFFFALSSTAESLWRVVSGVRPLRLNIEKMRLLPLFEEVYTEAVKTDKTLSKDITLYIQESMSINAFAFGKSTLALTRGSIELLDDECLKGLIAHELGHFSNGDTIVTLFASIGNFPLSALVKSVTKSKKELDKASKENKGSIIIGLFKTLNDAVYYLVKFVQGIGDLIIKHTSRVNEYRADHFAMRCGVG
jgi:heat shock protein HtpX